MRNVWLLCIAQALASCGTIMLVAFGGIVGTELAPAPALATLPLSLSVIGVASMSLPASLIMQRWGRRPAFIVSALVAAGAALLCAASIASRSFAGLCVAGLLLGTNMAFVQQYRFAATEYVPASEAGRAVSTVMIGTLFAAFLGPAVGELARDWGGAAPYSASFVVLALLCTAAALVLARLPAASAIAASGAGEAAGAARSVRELLREPTFRFAVLAGTVAYAVMSFIMTATPISMHVHHGFSGAQTSTVISAHLVAMYLPALATPYLIRRLGVHAMLRTGIVAMLICVAVPVALGEQFAHYLLGLVVLGLGWAFMFVAATALLTTTYAPSERFRAQGTNDLAVFGSQALASLLAGTAIGALGWSVVNLLALPALALLWFAHRRAFAGGRAAGAGATATAAQSGLSRAENPRSPS